MLAYLYNVRVELKRMRRAYLLNHNVQPREKCDWQATLPSLWLNHNCVLR